MSPVELHLPWDARIVFNSLYRAPDPSFLTQDLLAIEMPGDVMIDVGWYPEHDPLGAYIVSAYRRTWDNLMHEPFETRDLDEVLSEVRRLAHNYSQATINRIGEYYTSCSSGVQQSFALVNTIGSIQVKSATEYLPDQFLQTIEI